MDKKQLAAAAVKGDEEAFLQLDRHGNGIVVFDADFYGYGKSFARFRRNDAANTRVERFCKYAEKRPGGNDGN